MSANGLGAEFLNSTTIYSMYSMGDTSLDINRRNGVWTTPLGPACHPEEARVLSPS